MRLIHLYFSLFSLVLLVQGSAIFKGRDRDLATSDIELTDNSTTATAMNVSVPHTLSAQDQDGADGVNPLVCVLELSTVQCCETIEPLSLVVDLLKGVLGLLGIPLPPLDSLVAFNCQPSFLGIGCSEEVLCCSLVLPNLDIGVNCQPVETLF